MSGRMFAVVLPLASVEVGRIFDRARWPLHVTLVPNFRTAATYDDLLGVLRQLAERLPEQRPVVTEAAMFGPHADIAVDLVEPASLLPAHRLALQVLEAASAVTPLDPQYQRDGYRPHVTRAANACAQRDDRLRLDSIALVEIGPGGRMSDAVATAALHLEAGPAARPRMTGEDAAGICSLLRRAGVRSWVVGGWGVDALLDRQTREHHDLDLLVDVGGLDALDRVLVEAGFAVSFLREENRWIEADGRLRPSAFVATDAGGAELDVHVVDVGGATPIALSSYSRVFDRDALSGRGTIAGTAVDCTSVATQLMLHEGHPLPDRHRRDLDLLRTLS